MIESRPSSELSPDILKREANLLFNDIIRRLEQSQYFAEALCLRFFDNPRAIATLTNPLFFKGDQAGYELSLVRSREEDKLMLFKKKAKIWDNSEKGELIQIRLIYDVSNGNRKRLDSSFLIYDVIQGKNFANPLIHEMNTLAADREIRRIVGYL